jgi:hypothetical protein
LGPAAHIQPQPPTLSALDGVEAMLQKVSATITIPSNLVIFIRNSTFKRIEGTLPSVFPEEISQRG